MKILNGNGRLNFNHPEVKKLLNKNYIEDYQSRRFYIDEYEGQKELREEWFYDRSIVEAFVHNLNDMVYEWIIKNQSNLTITSIDDGTLTITLNPDWDVEESDGYFINRWLRRN